MHIPVTSYQSQWWPMHNYTPSWLSKNRHSLSKLLIASTLLIAGTLNAKQLIVYSTIPGRTSSNQYTARVREVGTHHWHNAFVVQTTCKKNPDQGSPIKGPDNDNGYYTNLADWSASYIAIEFAGMEVEVEVTKIGGPITKAKVRPVADAGAAVISGGKASFILTKHANVNIDINGQNEDQNTGQGYTGPAIHTFTVFGNPIFAPPTGSHFTTIQPGQDVRSLSDAVRKYITFAPGVHNIGKAIALVQGGVIYIPGDAIVHGTFISLDAHSKIVHNWKVYGSGAVSGETYDWYGDGINPSPRQEEARKNKPFSKDASGITVQGIVIIDPANHSLNLANYTYGADNHFLNVKILGWRKNSDGINAYHNSIITDCFFKIQDDCFYLGNNVRITNNVVWNDANGCVIMVNQADSRTVVDGITVIYHRAKWHDWGGGRAVTFRLLKQNNINVTIKNILIEDPLPSCAPFLMRLSPTDATGVHIQNIVCENIRQEAKEVGQYLATRDDPKSKEIIYQPQNVMLGASSTGKIQNITFKNCYYNGKYLRSIADGECVTHTLKRNADGVFVKVENPYIDHDSIEFIVDEN
jgi:hypothetical protein